jgi:FAD/FMN-containing dehydrogenase
MSSGQTDSGIRVLLERLLETALGEDLVANGVIAESGPQARELWKIREAIVEAQLYSGSIKHDVSVSVSRVADFILRATAGVTERLPGIRPMAFGHVGDGNIHFNLTQPRRRCHGLSRALAGVQRHRSRCRARAPRVDQRRARRRPPEASLLTKPKMTVEPPSFFQRLPLSLKSRSA